MLDNSFKQQFSFLILCLLIIVIPQISFAQTSSFDPYAASDARGYYLQPPAGSTSGMPSTQPVVADDNSNKIIISQAGMSNATSASVPTQAANAPIYTSTTEPVQDQRHYNTAPSAFSPITDRILSDPTYLPLRGQVEGVSSYSFANYEGDRLNDAGKKAWYLDKRTNNGTQDIIYGVTDNFSVNFAMEYASSIEKNKYTDGSPSLHFDSSGFTNPTFGATYRAIDQKQNPLNLDLRAYYTPDVFSAKASSSQDSGTTARGGQSGEVSAALSREMKILTVQAAGGMDFLGDRKTQNLSNGSTNKTQSSLDYFGALRTQTRFSERFSLNAGVVDTFYSRTDVANTTYGSSFTAAPYSVLNPYIALNYHFIPNRLVSTIEYDHSFIGKEKDIDGVPVTENGAYNNQDEDAIVARLRYVFF